MNLKQLTPGPRRDARGFISACECVWHALNRATAEEMRSVRCSHGMPVSPREITREAAEARDAPGGLARADLTTAQAGGA